jgi:macrolide phosphotransferase
LILAALAADAAPGKNFTNYRLDSSNPEIEQLQLWDRSGEAFVLKAPSSATGERELALELEGLRVVEMAKSSLPFEIPSLIGHTRDLDGSKAVLLSLLGGESADLSRYTPGKFSQSFAQAMAATHSINPSFVKDAGLPEFQAMDLVHQRVAEVDAIAATGRVSPALLSRWEQALEDVALFRFHPVTIHGAISQDALVVSGQELVGIGNWSSLSISDPAEDFRWLAGGALTTTFEDAILNYRATLPAADENLALRAQLYSELELGNWLVHCLTHEDQAEIAKAEDLLNELRDQLDSGALPALRAASFAGLAATTVMSQTSNDTTSAETAAQVEVDEPSSDQQDELPASSSDQELF